MSRFARNNENGIFDIHFDERGITNELKATKFIIKYDSSVDHNESR